MIYVCADIHGRYDLFMKLINEIDLKKEDTLYVIGDIIDRGEESYAIYKYIINHDNIILLRGNHEQMMIDYVRRRYPDWFLNGGYKTLVSIPYSNNDELDQYLHEMTTYFEGLPYYKRLEVNGKKYILVHAGIDYTLPMEKQKASTMLWIREGFIDVDQRYEDSTIIFGHTPNRTMQFSGTSNDDMIFFEHKIAIDGAACFGGQINCLRLDDLKAYKIK